MSITTCTTDLDNGGIWDDSTEIAGSVRLLPSGCGEATWGFRGSQIHQPKYTDVGKGLKV
jgi:hypothetical protein